MCKVPTRNLLLRLIYSDVCFDAWSRNFWEFWISDTTSRSVRLTEVRS